MLTWGGGTASALYGGDDGRREAFQWRPSSIADPSPATNVARLPNIAQVGGNDAATEAFDEPLTTEQGTAIVKDFIIGPPA